MTYNTPILFLVFNRPKQTEKVFNKIKSIKPKKLYISADGPRKNNSSDTTNCNKVKEIISKIDWDCKVKTLYRKENLGCRKAVSSGITWFFKNEDMGVILEDDCLPNDCFFDFCEKLLIKYKNNKKIMHISGNTFISDEIRNKYVLADYFFSKYPHIWGWATWRRAWELYDSDMINFSKKNKLIISRNNNRFLDRVYWGNIFNLTYKNKINSWGYVWQYSIWKNNCLSIQPKYNLVKNVGFGDDSTHTKREMFQDVNSFKLETHPIRIKKNKIVDDYISKKNYNITLLGFFKKLKHIFIFFK